MKKKKGAALVIVIMVTAVLMILGTAILNVSLSESKQASFEDKKIQAHYLARSGADATLNAWENSTTKPSGTSTVYLNSSNEFITTNTAPPNAIGKFDVTVAVPTGTDTVITSVGTVGTVTQTVTVTIKNITTTVKIPPTDAVSGESLGWYDSTNGQFTKGQYNHTADTGVAVKLQTKSSNGLKLPSNFKAPVCLQADKLFFISPFHLLHNSIVLTSTVIAFTDSIETLSVDKGSIVLKVLDAGVTRTGKNGTWGVVYFADKGYFFKYLKDGVTISSPNDIQINIGYGNLEEIKQGEYVNPFLGGTKTISSYSVLWS